MKAYQPDSETVDQLHGLGYVGTIGQGGDGDESGGGNGGEPNGRVAHRHEKPLLICDVDEVVLHLVDPFVEVLQERGYVLKDHSFRLTGNVYHAETGHEASQQEVWLGF